MLNCTDAIADTDIVRAIAQTGGDYCSPAEIVETLNKAINAGLADPQFKARLFDLGGTPAPMSAAEFGSFIAEETGKWAKVIKFANVKPE